MFDIYGVVDLYKERRVAGIKSPFRNYQYYDFDYVEHSHMADNAVIYYLERRSDACNYFNKNKRHLFTFGFVFSENKTQRLLAQCIDKRLSAEEIYECYEKLGLKCVHHFRGSFTLIVYDEDRNNITIIADQLNVLPIYYACGNGLFILSSAIKPILDSSLMDKTVDDIALAEFSIFDYPLGDRTYYKSIKQLESAQVVRAGQEGIQKHKYFSVSDLFKTELLSRGESLEILSNVLKINNNLYVEDADKFLLALTGGFDCRMNLGLIDRKPRDFLCYSYGMPGSKQIEIPKEIAQRLKLNYMPILLDQDFERNYRDCALRAIFYSDGTAPILRANYPYAFKRLSRFSDISVTGLFGSEVMRPIRNLGIQINEHSERIFMNDNFEKSLRAAFEYEENERYINDSIFDAAYGEIRDYLKKTYFSADDCSNKLIKMYRFFVGEGVRKYFMQEIRIERIYVETRFPYFDLAFVKALFGTPYAGIYNGALKESPIGRRNAQSLYAYVINKFKPELGRIPVDRGYCPSDLLSPVWFFKIMPGYMKAKIYYRKKGNDTFDAERWTDTIFSEERALMKKKTDIFPGTMYNKYLNGENIRDNYRFSRIFSLKYWFEHDGT